MWKRLRSFWRELKFRFTSMKPRYYPNGRMSEAWLLHEKIHKELD